MVKGMDDGMEQPLTFDAAFQRLDFCYEQLLLVIAAAHSEPEQILKLVDEAAALIAGLTDYQGEMEARHWSQLEKLFCKLQQVIEVTAEEKNKICRAMSNLKTGKQAIQSYRPPAVGMGYTEGKFLDQKK
jgi:hypothetical protein